MQWKKPQLVLDKFDKIGYFSNDNIAYYIAKNLTDGQIYFLNENLRKKMQRAMNHGVVVPSEYFQIARLNVAEAIKLDSNKSTNPANTLSGKHWGAWANQHAIFSTKVEDLSDSFRSKYLLFEKALKEAGVNVDIRTTRRSKKRAYLFHWSWKIGLGKCKASEATKFYWYKH